jgi:hypothetical protein
VSEGKLPRPSFRRRIRKSAVYRAVTLPQRFLTVLWQRHAYSQIIVHNPRFTLGLPASLLVKLVCGERRDRFRKPENLSILLVHNRRDRTLMEQSLDYLGIHDYTVLRLPADRPWRHTSRIGAVLDWLRSGACQTEYVLFADCDDAMMRDDPARAVNLLREADCDMLVSSTAYARYRNMPDVKAKTMALAPEGMRQGHKPRIHLNAGVYVARADFLAEYLTEAAKYVTDDDLPSGALTDMTDEEVLRRLPDFPRGIGSDQTIMRYLFPRFYPRMKIDYAHALALR